MGENNNATKSPLVTMGCPHLHSKLPLIHPLPTPLFTPNGIQIQPAVFPQFTHRTDQQTDRWDRRQVCSNTRQRSIDCIATRLIMTTMRSGIATPVATDAITVRRLGDGGGGGVGGTVELTWRPSASDGAGLVLYVVEATSISSSSRYHDDHITTASAHWTILTRVPNYPRVYRQGRRQVKNVGWTNMASMRCASI